MTRILTVLVWERFEEQDDDYQASLFPDGVPAVSVEAGVSLGWARYADAHVSIDRFGMSGPGGQVMEELGITAEAVVDAARTLLD